MTATVPDVPAGVGRFLRRGRLLQYITLAWNSAEAIIAVAAGFIAGSIALVGFGFDSAIEVACSLAAVWLLARYHDEARREATEKFALRLIGACFLLLAAYVIYDAIKALVLREPPDESLIGIVLAALSMIAMPLLVRVKRRVACQVNSGALEAEARQTMICAYLSAILLVGLGLNAALGWWWADPVAGLAMTPIIVRDGLEAIRGEACCSH
jgi:divalent metal cation (Fe/Co/Zn/Cd) transporter